MPTVHPRPFVSRLPRTRVPPPSFGRTSAGLLGAVLVLASCASDSPTGANETSLSADLASEPSFRLPSTGPTGTIVEVPTRTSPSGSARATT